jgi:SsrA-binding protein
LEQKRIKIVAVNKKAKFNYFIDQEFEAGMVLKGSEVKSLRDGRVDLKDSYGIIKKGEIFIFQMHISAYPFAHHENPDPLRHRKLLLHKREIKKLYGKINEKGFSLIPLKVYFKGGKAKISIALARGKRQYDKRETIKRRDAKRDMDRIKKEY